MTDPLTPYRKDAALQWNIAKSKEDKAYHRGRMTAFEDVQRVIAAARSDTAALVEAAGLVLKDHSPRDPDICWQRLAAEYAAIKEATDAPLG